MKHSLARLRAALFHSRRSRRWGVLLGVLAMAATVNATTLACTPVAADNCKALATGVNLHDTLGFGIMHLDVVQHVCVGWDGTVRASTSATQTQNTYGFLGEFGPFSGRPGGSVVPQGHSLPNIAHWTDYTNSMTATWVIWGDATVGGVGYSHQVGLCRVTWGLVTVDGGGGASVNRNDVFINFASVHTQHPRLECDGGWTVSYSQ